MPTNVLSVPGGACPNGTWPRRPLNSAYTGDPRHAYDPEPRLWRAMRFMWCTGLDPVRASGAEFKAARSWLAEEVRAADRAVREARLAGNLARPLVPPTREALQAQSYPWTRPRASLRCGARHPRNSGREWVSPETA
jgi:hypothetical protein